MINRLKRRLESATDHGSRVEIDCKLAYYELAEKRGDPIRLPWRWLAVAALIGAFFLPAPWMAASLAGAAGIWLGWELR
jgi:hypothetical protein